MKRVNALMIAMLVVMALSSCKKSTVKLLEGTWEYTRENQMYTSECGKFRYDRGERERIYFDDISGRVIYYSNYYDWSSEVYPDAPASVGPNCHERILRNDFVDVYKEDIRVKFNFELDEEEKHITITSTSKKEPERRYLIKEISGNTLELKYRINGEDIIDKYKKVK